MVLRRDEAGSPVAEYREYRMTRYRAYDRAARRPNSGANDDRHRFGANSQDFFDDPNGDVTVMHRTEARKGDFS
jgi:hypothetical protein